MPGAVVWPGVTPPGSVTDTLVSTMDIFPTVVREHRSPSVRTTGHCVAPLASAHQCHLGCIRVLQHMGLTSRLGLGFACLCLLPTCLLPQVAAAGARLPANYTVDGKDMMSVLRGPCGRESGRGCSFGCLHAPLCVTQGVNLSMRFCFTTAVSTPWLHESKVTDHPGVCSQFEPQPSVFVTSRSLESVLGHPEVVSGCGVEDSSRLLRVVCSYPSKHWRRHHHAQPAHCHGFKNLVR